MAADHSDERLDQLIVKHELARHHAGTAEASADREIFADLEDYYALRIDECRRAASSVRSRPEKLQPS